MADEYDAMTSEEMARERLRLYRMGVGLDALRRTLPESQGLGEFAGEQTLPPVQAALDVEIARRQRELNAQRDAVLAAEERAAAAGRTREAQTAVSMATGGAPPPVGTPTSSSPAPLPSTPWAGVPYRTDVTPQAAQAAQGAEEYKTVIASRRTPEGRIVFETQRVPVSSIAAQGPPESGEDTYSGPGLGVEEWKQKALAENAARRMQSARFGGVNPSGQPAAGFQVRAGEGGFSPSRQIPLGKTWEEVYATESPLVQEKWLEAKRQGQQLEAETAPIQEAALRRRILEQQARRLEDPSIEVKERMALAETVLPQATKKRAEAVEAWVQERLTLLRAMNQPSGPDIEGGLRVAAEKAIPPVDDFAQRMVDLYMSGEPAVAAARQRGGTGINIG